MMRPFAVSVLTAAVFVGALAGIARAQAQTPSSARTVAPAPAADTFITPPADYVIGVGDVLSVQFWKDRDMSQETVVVRPDGKITLPLINDVDAAGLTPEQLRVKITDAGVKFMEGPVVQVYVREIKSRMVFITGMIARSGPYPLLGPMTVMQLIATAGGLQDFADGKNITIIRVVNGQPTSYRFNYNDVVKRKNLKQDILLRPGDTVAVP